MTSELAIQTNAERDLKQESATSLTPTPRLRPETPHRDCKRRSAQSFAWACECRAVPTVGQLLSIKTDATLQLRRSVRRKAGQLWEPFDPYHSPRAVARCPARNRMY